MKSGKPLVLVLEDDPSMARLIQYNLNKKGYEVHITRSGAQGLEFCKHSIPDIILSDIMMPDMDGLSFRHHIQNDDRLNRVPFIFLTARAQLEDVAKGRQLGVTTYLTKPFEPKILIEAVQNALKKDTA